MRRTLTANDLQKAIGRINDLKASVMAGAWPVAYVHCQLVRELLPDIAARHPAVTDKEREELQTAASKVSEIENRISRGIHKQKDPSNAHKINDVLTNMQKNLEKIVSATAL